jgi:hypothetical protein
MKKGDMILLDDKKTKAMITKIKSKNLCIVECERNPREKFTRLVTLEEIKIGVHAGYIDYHIINKSKKG